MATVEKSPAGENDTQTKVPAIGGVSAQRGTGAPIGSALDAGFGFQGGPIIANPDVFVSFWGASWNDASHAPRQANLIQFVQDFMASDYMNILSQYGVGNGAGACGTYRGSSVLTTVSGDITDNDIHNAIQSMIDGGQLPEPGTPSSTALLLFMDEDIRIRDANLGVTLCEPSGDNAFGYHYFFTTTAGHKCYYSVIPGLSDTCLQSSCASDASCSLHLSATQEQRQTQVASHEFSEMVTDPEVSAWRDPQTGAENGDNCNGQSGVISVAGRSWTVQLMYSKTDDANGGPACVIAPAHPLPSLLPHTGWHTDDMTAQTGAPVAAGRPSGYLFNAQGTQHVAFRDVNGHINEMWWDGNGWHTDDMTAQTGAPLAVGNPSGYMFNAQGTQHVAFRDVNGHINEMWWDGNGWHTDDMTAQTGAPLADSDPSGYMFDAQGTQHVAFRDAAGHINEMWWNA